jgi:hypothetical protein
MRLKDGAAKLEVSQKRREPPLKSAYKDQGEDKSEDAV